MSADHWMTELYLKFNEWLFSLLFSLQGVFGSVLSRLIMQKSYTARSSSCQTSAKKDQHEANLEGVWNATWGGEGGRSIDFSLTKSVDFEDIFLTDPLLYSCLLYSVCWKNCIVEKP